MYLNLRDTDVIDFLRDVLNEQVIKTDFGRVRETAKKLAEASLKHGCDNRLPDHDVLGIKIRYINTWLQKTDQQDVLKDFEMIRRMTDLSEIHEWGEQLE